MSFTRFNYDPCRTKKKNQESTGPGRWILNKPGYGDKPCYFEDPHIRLQQWGANIRKTNEKSPIDILSDLDGRSRKATKSCVNNVFPNDGVPKSYKKKFPVCKAFTEETRASHPAWLYRDVEQTRWEYPLLDPQENTCMPFHNNLSSRILEKDYYRTKIPTPMNL